MGTLFMLLLATATTPADTIVELRRGDQIVFDNLSGEIVIEGRAESRLEVRGMDGPETGVVVTRSGGVVTVRRDDGKGRRRSVELAVRLPTWAEVSVDGRSLDVMARGLGAPLTVSTLQGDVDVGGSRGAVTVSTIRGEVLIRDVEGPVSASSQSDDVTLEDVRGDVAVYTGDGDLELTGVVGRRVEAETQDGDIDFDGPILDGGEYGFFVHDGDVTLRIPESTSARVSVSTFDGDFESDFPVLVERFTGGREFDFTIGAGSARIRVQVFDGMIRLLSR